jgi:phosphoesterase RecJ-like protein
MSGMKELNRKDIERLDNRLKTASKTVIVTHMKPDGDAIGSTTALYHFIRKHTSSDVCIVLNDIYQPCLSFMTEGSIAEDIHVFSEDSERTADAIAAADLIICLDFNSFQRTDRLAAFLAESKAEKILIDHHLFPERENFDIVFSETEISSASELLYQILMSMPAICGDASKLPIETSVSLMTGMTTDTNNFANSVYPSTLIMASALLAAGVNRDNILEKLYNQHSENRLRLMGHMMKDLLVVMDNGVAYIVLDKATQKEYSIQEGDTEGFVNMPLSIATVRMSILIKEDTDRLRVSIRSKKGTSANRCARMYFNGGGHENAAGGRLEIPVAEAAEYIETHVHEYLKKEHEADKY